MIALVPLPIVALFFIFVFIYGIASGETDHPLWQASSFAVVLIVIAGAYVYQTLPL